MSKLLASLAAYAIVAVAIYLIVGGYVWDHSDHSDASFRSAQLVAFLTMWGVALPWGFFTAWLLDD